MAMATMLNGGNENDSDTLLASSNKQYTALVDIKELSDRKALLHLPTILFLGILTIVGIIGNTLVLYVYGWKIRSSNHRIFIIFLGAIDLMVCAVAIPTVMFEQMYPLMQNDKWVCKLGATTSQLMVITSIFVLLIIAWDRYWKVCKPFKRQMSIRQAKVSCIVVTLISACLSLPGTLLYGTSTVQTEVPGVTGKRCYVDDAYADTDYFISNSVTSFILVFAIFIILSILYYIISLKIKERNRRMNTPNSNIIQVESRDKIKINARLPTSYSNEHDIDDTTEPETNIDSTKTTSPTDRNMKTAQRSSSRRTTVMLFTISIVFFVSYFPQIILTLIVSLHEDFENNLGTIEYCIYNLFFWSFYINNMANPIIYGVCDKRFIKEMKKLCHGHSQAD